MDHFISMYIDDELSLDEKIKFVDYLSGNKQYTESAVSLLKQEKLLCKVLNQTAPKPALMSSLKKKIWPLTVQSLGWAVAVCILIAVSFTFLPDDTTQDHAATNKATSLYRFVIHQQGAQQVEITGSFTQWQRLPLTQSGTKGYWEISLDVHPGEHRYTFIVDGAKFLPDPTVVDHESDDFGETNSIIRIKA